MRTNSDDFYNCKTWLNMLGQCFSSHLSSFSQFTWSSVPNCRHTNTDKNKCENDFIIAFRKSVLCSGKTSLALKCPKNQGQNSKHNTKIQHYRSEGLQDLRMHHWKPGTGHILDWKTNAPQNMSRNIDDHISNIFVSYFSSSENLGVQICPYCMSKQVRYYNSKTWLNMLGQCFSNHLSSFRHWTCTNTAVCQTLCAKLNTRTNTDLVALYTAEQTHQTSDHSPKELNVTIIMLVGDFGHRYCQHVRHMDHLQGLWKQNTHISYSYTVCVIWFCLIYCQKFQHSSISTITSLVHTNIQWEVSTIKHRQCWKICDTGE